MAARSVRWRSQALRLPPESSRKAWSRRAAMCSTSRPATRDAASSIARGMPSRRRQIWATKVAFASSSMEIRLGGASAFLKEIHCLKLQELIQGRIFLVFAGSRAKAHGKPPRRSTPSGSRLETSIFRSGRLLSRSLASAAQASSMCSQLSKISSVWRSCEVEDQAFAQ